MRGVGAGYPRVIGAGGRYYPGMGVYGEYVIGADGQPVMAANAAPAGQAMMPMPVHMMPQPVITSPPWRGGQLAPGVHTPGERHVPMDLAPETFAGMWGGVGGAPAGTVIIFSARPQKPFKGTRLFVRRVAVNTNGTAIGSLVGSVFAGTDLQQAEITDIDLETIGAGGTFDSWVSFTDVEPGVLIRLKCTLFGGFPVAPDSLQYKLTLTGHYVSQ